MPQRPMKSSRVQALKYLKAVGRPVFYADAPGDKKMKGEGSILFNGNEDGFVLDRPLKMLPAIRCSKCG